MFNRGVILSTAKDLRFSDDRNVANNPLVISTGAVARSATGKAERSAVLQSA
jgi:hypothetical protein